MACSASVGCNDSGGAPSSDTSLSGIKTYHKGKPGDKAWVEAAECSEAMALKYGHAVATNTPAKFCEHIQGIPVIIGSSFDSLQGFAQNTNMNFATNGNRPAMSTNLSLNATV